MAIVSRVLVTKATKMIDVNDRNNAKQVLCVNNSSAPLGASNAVKNTRIVNWKRVVVPASPTAFPYVFPVVKRSPKKVA